MRNSNSSSAISECLPQEILTGFPSCKDYTSEAEALEFGVDARHYCDGSGCFTREKRLDYESRLWHIEGLPLPENVQGVPIPALDPIIVSHDFDTRLAISTSVYGSAIAVPYWHVPGLLSLDPELLVNFRSIHNLDQDQLLVLHGEGHDNRLENLFVRSCDRLFFDLCSLLSPVVLIAPGYSIYTDGCQCRHWQPYNLKRSAKFFFDASNYGLPCVPWIASNHSRDTERICEWLNNQCHSATHVAVNFQTRGKAVLVENIRFAKAIEAASNRQLHWLISGIACKASMSEIAENLAGGLTFITSKPIQRGRARRNIYDTLKITNGNIQKIVDNNVIEQRKQADTATSSRYKKN